MNTTDKNAEIARWMGLEFTILKDAYLIINDNEGNQYHSLDELKYHSDWNWIMAVVEKIEDFYTINGEEVEFRVVQYEDEVLILAKYQLKRWENIIEVLSNGDGKLKNTHEAVYQFVVWYNQDKQNENTKNN